MKHRIAIAFAVLLPVVGFVPAAMATTITNPFIFSGPGSGTGNAITLTPGGSVGNTVDIAKTFTSNGVLSYSFLMPADNTGVTTYLFTEHVTNNTGTIWEDFKIAMACGQIGEGNPSIDDCGFFPLIVNYDLHPTNSDPASVLDVTDLTLLHWSSMNVAPGHSFDLTFLVDTCANCSGQWQVFETPSVVPEPSTLILAVAGLGGIAVSLRRRKKLEVES